MQEWHGNATNDLRVANTTGNSKQSFNALKTNPCYTLCSHDTRKDTSVAPVLDIPFILFMPPSSFMVEWKMEKETQKKRMSKCWEEAAAESSIIVIQWAPALLCCRSNAPSKITHKLWIFSLTECRLWTFVCANNTNTLVCCCLKPLM